MFVRYWISCPVLLFACSFAGKPNNQEEQKAGDGEQTCAESPDHFMRIVNKKYFIDKSMFIQDFFAGRHFRAVLAPSGFGKSTNLMMLRHFLELPISKDGTVGSKYETDTYKIFANLKINGSGKVFKKHFASYNVIYLDLALCAEFKDAETFFKKFRTALLAQLNTQLEFVRSAAPNDLKHKKTFSCFNKPDPAAFSACVKHLMNSLNHETNKSSIVLIDGFHAPFHTILLSRTLSHPLCLDSKKISIFLEKFVSRIIKYHPCVKRAFLTGVMHVSIPAKILHYETIFENLELANAFGFTRDDVKKLVARYILNEARESEIGRYFDGYSSYTSAEETVLAPKTVVQYLHQGPLKDLHELKSSKYETVPSLRMFAPLLKPNIFGSDVIQSFGADGIPALQPNINTFRDLLKLHKIVADFNETGIKPQCSESKQLLFQYMFENGFFTQKAHPQLGNRFHVPNSLVKQQLQRMVLRPEFFTPLLQLGPGRAETFADSVIYLKNTSDSLERFVRQTAAIFETVGAPASEQEIAMPFYTFISGRTRKTWGELDFNTDAAVRATNKLRSVERKVCRRVGLFVLLPPKLSRGVMIQFKHRQKESSSEALVQIVTESHAELFEIYPVKSYVLLGVHLNETHCGASLLVNSTDLNESLHFTTERTKQQRQAPAGPTPCNSTATALTASGVSIHQERHHVR